MGTNISYYDQIGEAFINSGIQLGYGYNPDYHSAYGFGFSQVQSHTEFGRRHSTYKAFLLPFFSRKNLRVEIDAFVVKILINGQGKAFGVEYVQNGSKHVAYASKEVILSAGAINSPQLLILSGIGPREDLVRLSIPVVQELPVGKILKEHLTYYGLIITTNVTTKIDEEAAWKEFVEQGSGPLTAPGGVTAVSFINSNNLKDSVPDIELIHIPGGLLGSNRTLSRALLISDDILTEYTKSIDNDNQFTITPTLLHPESTGFLKVETQDPFKPPLLFGNFFTKEKDLVVMLKGVRIVQQLLRTQAFRKIDAKLFDAPVPGCEELPYDSDVYWFCAFRRFTGTINHASSTCKMGPYWDNEAVVDNQLRVYGIQGLRVADASIIPYIPSGHTNAACIMIGERASDFIKGSWLEEVKKA